MPLHLALEDALHTCRQKRQINMSLAKDDKRDVRNIFRKWVLLTIIELWMWLVGNLDGIQWVLDSGALNVSCK